MVKVLVMYLLPNLEWIITSLLAGGNTYLTSYIVCLKNICQRSETEVHVDKSRRGDYKASSAY